MIQKLIALLLALLLTTLPALAEDAPVFSEDLTAIHMACQALHERYGLTSQSIGLFDTKVERYGRAAIVRLLPRTRPHPSLTGEYLVLVSDGTAQAFWTHDDVEPSRWQSGDLNSPAWGEPQLQAYLRKGSFDREYFDEPYIPQLTPHPFQGGRVYSLYDDSLTDDEAALPIALAQAAIRKLYGLSSEEAAALRTLGVDKICAPGGEAVWVVEMYHKGQPDEANYTVRIDAVTHIILEAKIFTGGIG